MTKARPILSICAAENTLIATSGTAICVLSDSPDDIDAPMRLKSMGEAGRHTMGECDMHWVYEHHVAAAALAGRFLGVPAQARQ